MDEKKELPQEINYELIREMRRSGLGIEANRLLNAYYDDLKKMKEQMKKEYIRKKHLKNQFKKVQNHNNKGVCKICGITFNGDIDEDLCGSPECRIKLRAKKNE